MMDKNQALKKHGTGICTYMSMVLNLENIQPREHSMPWLSEGVDNCTMAEYDMN